MTSDRRTPEESLLDLHLDRLDDEQRSWIEAELRRDAEFQAKSDRLGRLLEPLDHLQPSPAPANLAEKILAHIERSTSGLHRGDSAFGERYLLPVTTESYAPWPFPRVRDLIAVAACLLLLFGVFVPGVSELRDRSQRAACADNLGSIYRGTSLYQQAFAGSLPFAGRIRNASWLPGGDSTRPYASNSRHPFLLVKLMFGPQPNDFVCPSSPNAQPMRVKDPGHRNDFALARNVCYDTLSLGGDTPNLRPRAAIAYASDRNPLFIGARFNASVDPDKANSPAHRRRGQTVLTLDGCATWSKTPLFGPKRDNLWVIRNIRRYKGTENPTSRDDAFLVPGFPVTDPMVRKSLRR